MRRASIGAWDEVVTGLTRIVAAVDMGCEFVPMIRHCTGTSDDTRLLAVS